MKLTKDDFEVGYVDEMDGFSPKHYPKDRPKDTVIKESKITVDQILKNQEIAERLKKALEFWEDDDTGFDLILQKILENKE